MASATKMVVSCCAYGLHVIIALGNDKDLGFIDFQLFPGLEGRNGSGQLEVHVSVARWPYH